MYQQPPPALARMATAPKAPDVIITPRRDFALLCEIPSLPSIAEIAMDDVKLAGVRCVLRISLYLVFVYGYCQLV